MNEEIMTLDMTTRELRSDDFIINTKAIRELSEKLMKLLYFNTCGAIIFGRTRIGKTTAILCLTRQLHDRYGESFPVIIWDLTEHVSTEKNFYGELLIELGIDYNHRTMTALALRARVINEMALAAYSTPYRQIVIMLDEAWMLTENDFSWLMDLYNKLKRKDILLFCFMFGTEELKSFKAELKQLGLRQIVERFMLHEIVFYGMKEPAEMMLCLIELDKHTVTTGEGKSSIKIIDYFFPDREKGKTFASLTDDFWNAFMQVRAENAINPDDVPMQYFIDAFIALLIDHGRFGEESVAFPTYNELYDSVVKSKFSESGFENENVGKKKKFKRRRR